MILRNGINSTLRARGRSVLFTILILVLTVALTLGMGAWTYSSSLLQQMDNSYTSIAVVEYMGADYPDVDAADAFARQAAADLDAQAISNIDGVKLWESTDRTLATIDGYTRLSGDVPYEDYGVLICTSFVPIYTNGLKAYTAEELPIGVDIAITDLQNWRAKLITPDTQTDWVPLYLTNHLDSIFYRYNTDPESQSQWDGQYDEASGNTYFTKDQLPSEYILLDQAERRAEYEYFKKGQYEFGIYDNIYDDSYPQLTYDASTDTYYGQGKVIRGYTGICVDPVYSREYSDDFLMTMVPDQQGLSISSGKRYIVHGMFSPDGNNLNNFILIPFEDESNIPPWQEITDDTYDPIFDHYAQKYAVANAYVRLESSADIAALEVFQQNTVRLESGRFPASAEAGTCVVSHDVALQLDLTVGDTIDLSVLNSAEDDRFELSGTGNKNLEVVGITTSHDDYIGCVWVSDAEGNFTSPLFGYQLGQAVLENELAREAADQIAQQCGENVRVTLYDQGYSAAAQPLQTMQTTAMAITIAASCATVAVLLLFGFLFIGRQKETVQVLMSLGTAKHQISLWLLSGATVICGFATVMGVIIGSVSLNKIIQLALQAASGLYVADQRFSEAAIGYVKDTATISSVPLWPAVVSGIGILVTALCLCLLFLRFAQRQNTPKRGKQTIRVPKGGTSVSGKGALRFAMLSAKRGGWRSGVVPASALVLSLLLGILAFGAQSWSAQIDVLYRNTVISGSAVSTNGRQDTKLQIPATSARNLWNSQLLKDICVSIGWNYWLSDEMPNFGDGEFAEYRRQEWIGKQPQIIALNELTAAPEFMHGLSPDITWLNEFDQNFLSDGQFYSFMTTRFYGSNGAILKIENEEIAYPCVVTQEFLDRRGLQIGDNFSVSMRFKQYPWDEERYVELYSVGVFNQTCAEDNIYVPLSFWCDPDWITGETDLIAPGERPTIAFRTNEDRDKYLYNTTSFETCVFTLKSADCLEQLRDYLNQQKFSQVRNLSSNRTTIVLKDQTFVETVDGLGRYISFSRFLFPILFAVVALLGFVISWLMINSRRMEFAILRGLGTSRIRVFFSFFSEQMLLCVSGCVLSAIVLTVTTGLSPAILSAVLIFLLCYLAGCALSVIMVGRTNLMLLLSERE